MRRKTAASRTACSATGHSKGTINFQSSGNVGIGTTSPARTLEVVGTANNPEARFSYTAGDTMIEFKGNVLSAAYIAFQDGSGYLNLGQIRYNNSSSSGGYAGGPNALVFNTAQYDRVVINSSGQVGIGTMSPSAALQVVGDIKYSGVLTDVSDRRLKKDIQRLAPGQLAKIMQLQPVSFVMKDDPKSRTELGLIAQDTEPFYPNLVQTAPDGTKSLNYVGLASPLIEAMQEQQAEIERLQAALAVVFCFALVPGFILWRNRTK